MHKRANIDLAPQSAILPSKGDHFGRNRISRYYYGSSLRQKPPLCLPPWERSIRNLLAKIQMKRTVVRREWRPFFLESIGTTRRYHVLCARYADPSRSFELFRWDWTSKPRFLDVIALVWNEIRVAFKLSDQHAKYLLRRIDNLIYVIIPSNERRANVFFFRSGLNTISDITNWNE